MTIKSAIAHLNHKIIACKTCGESKADGVNVVALEMAVEALNKQIGTKPHKVHWNEQETRVLCPQCNYRFYSLIYGEKIAGNQLLYCPCCGQRVDWGEEAEK